MNRELNRSKEEAKPQRRLIRVLAGMVGVLSLCLPTGRAGSEGILISSAPVATVGASRSAERSLALPEPDQVAQEGRRPLQRPIDRSLETAPTGFRTDAKLFPEDNETEEALLSVQQPRATTYRYDDLNRLIEVVYADGTRISYSYDAAGNLTQTVTRPR